MPRLFKDHHSGIRLSTPDEMDHIRALIVQIITASTFVSRQGHQWKKVSQPFGVSAQGVAAAAKDAVDWNIVTGPSVRVLCGRGYAWLSFRHLT